MFASLAVQVISASDAKAAACCGAGYGLGQRLSREERFGAVLSTRFYDISGNYDRFRDYIASPSGNLDRELRLDVSGLARITTELQVGVSVPWITSWKSAGTLSSNGGAGRLGDVSAFARWDFVPPGGRRGIPGIAATLSVLAPTGKSPPHAEKPLDADVSGLGPWEIRPGFVIEQAWWTGWFVTFGGSVGLRTRYQDRDGSSVALSPRMQLVGAGGHTFPWGLGLGGGLMYEREAGPSRDGVRGADTTRDRLALLGIASWTFDPHWMLVGSAQWDPPWSGVARNEFAGLAVSFLLRRAWTVYD